MRVLDNFYCVSCERKREQFHDPEDNNEKTCDVCGAPAVLVRHAPQICLESISGDFKVATSRWTKDYERRVARARRQGDL